MAIYDKTKSLGQNAIKGVDITEPSLPYEVTVTDDTLWHTPDSLSEAINEYLYNKYGEIPTSYSYELIVGDLEWENE